MFPLPAGQNFAYTLQLGDPSDTSQNYVQIVVRYSSTSKVIATLNLINVSGQRFVGTFQVPADVSGQGYYLDIQSTVYTDSAYSVLNTNYPISCTQYYALANYNMTMNQGAGNDGIDEATLIKVLEKLLGKHIGGIKIPEYKETKINFSPLINKMDEILENTVQNTKHHILSHEKMDSIHASIKSLPEPIVPEKVDLYPVIEGVQNLAESIGSSETRLHRRHDILERKHDEIKKIVGESHGELGKKIDDMVDGSEIYHVSKKDMKFFSAPKQEEKPKEKPQIHPKIKALVSPYEKHL